MLLISFTVSKFIFSFFSFTRFLRSRNPPSDAFVLSCSCYLVNVYCARLHFFSTVHILAVVWGQGMCTVLEERKLYHCAQRQSPPWDCMILSTYAWSTLLALLASDWQCLDEWISCVVESRFSHLLPFTFFTNETTMFINFQGGIRGRQGACKWRSSPAVGGLEPANLTSK